VICNVCFQDVKKKGKGGGNKGLKCRKMYSQIARVERWKRVPEVMGGILYIIHLSQKRGLVARKGFEGKQSKSGCQDPEK